MKFLAALIPLCWLLVFLWGGAYEIGAIAALISVIGFCGIFIVALHYRARHDLGYAIWAALLSPIAFALVLEGWYALFPPSPCDRGDCVTVTVTIPPES